MAFGGVTGSIVGALGGIAVMGGVLAIGFGAHRNALKIFLVLFVANAAGYFIGEWAYNLALALVGCCIATLGAIILGQLK